MPKNQAKAKQHPAAEFWLFENNLPSSSTLSFKNDFFETQFMIKFRKRNTETELKKDVAYEKSVCIVQDGWLN